MEKIVYKGSNSSKNKFLFISGVHGNEITSLQAQRFFISEINTKKLKKENYNIITILYGVNKTGLAKCVREKINQEMSDDINRNFIRNTEDCENIIKEEIAKHNIVVDIHSSPYLPTELFLLDIDNKLEDFQKYLKLLGFDYCQRYSAGNTIKNYTNQYSNKYGFTLELNGVNSIDYDSAKKGSDILFKIIETFDFGLFTNNSNKQKRDNNILEIFTIKSKDSGIFDFYNFYDRKTWEYKKNEIIGSVTDYKGKVISNVYSPCNMRIVCGVRTGFYVGRGQDLFECFPVE